MKILEWRSVRLSFAKPLRRRTKSFLAIIAIASVAAMGSVVAPARADPSDDRLMDYCSEAVKVQGEQNHMPYQQRTPGLVADDCDLEEQGFTTYWGSENQSTPLFDNCTGTHNDGTGDLIAGAGISASTDQAEGRYAAKEFGGGGTLGDILNVSYLKHEGTISITTKTVSATNTANFTVPPGYKMWVGWTPMLTKQTYRWAIDFPEKVDGHYYWFVYGEQIGVHHLGNNLPDGQWNPHFETC